MGTSLLPEQHETQTRLKKLVGWRMVTIKQSLGRFLSRHALGTLTLTCNHSTTAGCAPKDPDFFNYKQFFKNVGKREPARVYHDPIILTELNL